MTDTNQLDADLKGIVAAFFAANVSNLLADAARLEGLARLANIPPERVPAIRDALQQASRAGLS